MHPDGTTKSVHELVLLSVLGFEAFYTPLALSYLSDPDDLLSHHRTAMTINVVVEILLAADIMLHLNTAVYERPDKHSSLITSRRTIIRRYVTRGFVAHVLGSLPAEIVCLLTRADGDTRTLLETSLPIYVVCHVLRFVRLAQLPSLWRSNWMRALSSITRAKTETLCGPCQPVLGTVVTLGVGVVVIAHYLTCVLRVMHLAEDFLLVPQPTSLSALYTKNLRQVVVGLFGSVKETEQGVTDAYCIVLALLGLMITAFVVSSVSIAVVNMQTTSHTEYHQSTQLLASRMDKLRLPQELQGRIHKYCDHLWGEYDVVDAGIMEFTRQLPQPLALDVLLHRYLDVVSGLEFWLECSPGFLSALIASLDVRVFGQEDYILREGDVGSELFMIHRGFVEQTVAGKEVQRLTHGDTFGELALLLDYSRAANVQAVTFVESCVLPRQAFYTVLARYPDSRARIVVSVLAAGLRSRESPELWPAAVQLLPSKKTLEAGTPHGEEASGATENAMAKQSCLKPEVQLSSKQAAELLVDALHLEQGPCVSLSAAIPAMRERLSSADSAGTRPSPQPETPTAAETQILQALACVSKAVRRLEGDLAQVKYDMKLANARRKARTNDTLASVNEESIELTIPSLPAGATLFEDPASVAPLAYAGASPSKSPGGSASISSKVQPRPSRFHRVASVSNPLDAAANVHLREVTKHRSSSLTIGDARSSAIAGLADEDAAAYSSPDTRAISLKTPRRRSIQRRMSRW
jgi:hypothetical protein